MKSKPCPPEKNEQSTGQQPAVQEPAVYQEIVDTLVDVFKTPRRERPIYAKGVVCEANFRPAHGAENLSSAPHLRGGPVAATVRFSNFAGIPDIPDSDPNAGPRGMAVKFHLPGGVETDIVAHSYNGYPVRTADEFLEFARAIAASGPDVPAPKPLDHFLTSHPQAKLFLEARKPVPVSFATETYYGVNAFRFVNSTGRSRFGRYRLRPVAGEAHLDPQAAARKPVDFLFDELATRRAGGPVVFLLLAQLADESDPATDGSRPWPEQRPQMELGTLTITQVVPDSPAMQRGLIFDPTRLVEGIELSGDPLLPARSAVYALSFERRVK